jgi:mannose-6-phosphate isomerase
MVARGRFPLLVKLLDAQKDLSVQVHPDDAYAALYEGGELGKTEMWYVLHAAPGAEIIYGLAPGANREGLCDALAQGDPGALLHRVAVRAGDCAFVPAGMVHALLRGVVVAEIQQNSDTTYRVYDWGRLGADGRHRPLHVRQALEVIDWSQIAPKLAKPVTWQTVEGARVAKLVQCPYFTVERVDMDEGQRIAGCCDGDTFEIWGCLSGEIELTWAGAPRVLAGIRFVLLPATLGDFGLTARAASTLLRVFI